MIMRAFFFGLDNPNDGSWYGAALNHVLMTQLGIPMQSIRPDMPRPLAVVRETSGDAAIVRILFSTTLQGLPGRSIRYRGYWHTAFTFDWEIGDTHRTPVIDDSLELDQLIAQAARDGAVVTHLHAEDVREIMGTRHPVRVR